MNRIYKVIWNEALNCFTAVGEYAKGRGKSSKSSVSSNATINTTSNISVIKTLRLSAMGLGLLAAGFGMQANAVGTYFAGDDPAPKIYTNPLYHQTLTVQGGETVIGDSNTKNISVTADQWDKSLTIKLDKTVDLGADGSLKTGDTLVDNSGITITASNPINNVVLGNTGLNNGGNQITNVASGVGNDSNAANIGDLNNAVAANKTKYYSVNSTAVGNANNDGATGPNAMAMGGNASATGGQAIAIGSGESGQNTAALGEQSIAIGANVVSRGGSSIAIGGDDLNAASEANLDGTANIGKNTGTVNTVFKSYTGRDLVEPAYYARNTEAAGAASIAIGAKALSEGALSTAIGVQSSSSGVASSAFGIGASASKDGSVALGAGAFGNIEDGVALGSKSLANRAATGAQGQVFVPTSANGLMIESTRSVTLGAVSVGTGEDGGNRQIVNVAAGSQDSDAVNVSQLKALDTVVAGIDFPIRSSNTQPYTTSVTGTDALAVGSNANANGSNSTVVGENAFGNSNATVIGEGARSSYNGFAGGQDAKAGVNSVAIGQRATNGSASRAVAIGYQAKATANDTIAIGLDAQAKAQGGVALGKGASANAINSVALGQNSVGAVQSGASFLTNVAADANNGTVSVGAVGSERRIVNVAGGSADTDAVNVSQLKVVTETANRGWDISAQGDSATASTVEPGDSVDFNSKNSNITVSKTANSNDVSFELNNDLDLGNNGSVTTGNIFGGTQVNRLGIITGGLGLGGVTTVSGAGVTVTGTNPLSNATLTSDGLSMINGPSITKSNGINAGNKKVVNVANGVSAKDAVNVSQLNSTSAAARTKVVKGTNVASVDFSTDSITGQDVYTVNANGSKTSAGSTAIDVSATTDASNLTDYTVDLSQGTKDSLIKADNSVQYDNLAKTSVTLGNIGSTTPVTLTNVAAGEISEDSSDAVNGSQLFETNAKVDKGFALKAADGDTVQKSLGQAVEVVGSNDNIDTRVRNGKIEVKLNNDLDLGSNGSVSTGNILGGTQVNRFGMVTGGLAMGGVTTVSGVGVTVTGTNPLSNATLTSDGLSMINGPSITKSNGINAGNKKIVNVADGVSAKDAVNVSQLNSTSAAAKTEVAAGTNVADVAKSTGSNGQDVYTVNANGVTASAGSSAVTVTANEKDELTNITDYAVDLSADSKASLVKADSAMQTVITQIDGEDVKTLTKDNNTANFLSGKNIVLSDENGDIKVATVEDVTFTSVTTGDTLLSTGGVSFLGGSTVRLSSMGLNNGGNRITEVADGSELDDAVNVRQLNGVIETANKGWDISAQGNSTTASNVGPGEAVDFNSKNSNIRVSKTANSNDVSFELNNNLDLGDNGSVEMGSSSPFGLGSTTTLDRSGLTTGNSYFSTTVDGLGVRTGNGLINTTVSSVGVAVSSPLSTTLLSGNGLNIIGGPSVTKSGGINAGNKKIINVDDGVQAKDAVNVSQLNSASAAAKTEVAAGTNVAGVVKSTGQNGQDVYTVNADGVTASAGSSAVTITAGAKDATNITDYQVDLSESSKNSLVNADNALQTVVTQIDGNEVKTLNKTNNTANFLTGDNIVLSAEDGGIKVSTAEDVTFTSVTTGDTLLNTGGVSFLGGSTVRLSSMGLDNGGNRITEVADGEDDTDAVNVRQLNATNSTVDLGLDFTGDDTAVVVNRKLGQTLTIQGGATELTENNIGVVADEEGSLNVKLAEDVILGKNGSVRMESTVLNNAGVTITDGPNQTITLSNEGLDNGNNRIIKVGEGIAPTDAVNFAQLTTTNNEIAKGIKIGDGNSDNDQQFALGDTINITGDNNLTTTASATGVQVKLNNQLDLGDEGRMQIGNSIMNSTGFTFVDNGMGRTVRLSSTGLDNGGNTIRNVGRGELNSDAVNVGQLREVTIALDRGWDITAQGDIATQVRQGDAIDLNSRDGNIKVSRTLVNNGAALDANTRLAAVPAGANDISFDLNPDISVVSVTAGDTTINDNGLTIAGGPSITKSGIDAADNKVTNVQNGEVTAESQDAINGSQLYAQGTGISSIIGGNTVYNPDDGSFTNSNIGGTGQSNIDGAIASIRQGTIEINENVQVNTTNITNNTTDIAVNTSNIATNTSNIMTNTTNITTNTTNIKTNTDRLDAGLNFGADSGATINKPVGDESVLSFTGGNNITTTAEGSSIKFDLNGNISVDSVTAGNTVINSSGITMQDGPSMTAQGLYAGNQRMTGVADGVEATDAVNYSQLSALDSRLNNNMSDLGYKIDEVEDDANAGISAAMAMSAMPQAYIAGKSLIGGGVGTYNGESAVAIGFSKLSNDGRWVIKVNGTADTQGNVGGAVGAGFHFD
ncbi:YadA-like family protein [Psychrobacter piscatorii]|uniref:YadA-like family protein n=1 Tax=Psychrobacter piscatorii TaxID=554343 RepID=UPI0037353544